MSSFGRRARRHRAAHHKKLAPWAIILICVGAALIVSLIVGNLLKLFLDEETYDRLVNPPSIEDTDKPTSRKTPEINAYPFTLGGKLSTAKQHASVSINQPDGTLRYQSPVSEQLGIDGMDVKFERSMSSLISRSEYICGVFYPQAPSLEGEDLQYAETARERAILREFIVGGGNEIVLRDLDLTSASIHSVVSYLNTLKSELNTPIGVAVPLSVIRAENGWKILVNLQQYCDLLAIDLTGIEDADAKALLQSLSYYRDQYAARVLLDETQTALIEALDEVGVTDFQIISAVNPK